MSDPQQPTAYPALIPVGDGGQETHRHIVKGSCGGSLQLHEWRPRGEIRGAFLLLAGIGMHGRPYECISSGFTKQGFVLLVPDLRNHGESQGKHGQLASMEQLCDDIARHVDLIRRLHPGTPLFIGGESMGGLLIAEFASRTIPHVGGLVLLAPAFRTRWQLMITMPLRIAGTFLRTGRIDIDHPRGLESSCRLEGFAEAKSNDPLAVHLVSLRYLLRLSALGFRWPAAAATVQCPVLVHLAGRDQVIDSKFVCRVADAMLLHGKDIEVKHWPAAYHTLFWDPDAPAIVDHTVQWMLRRSGS